MKALAVIIAMTCAGCASAPSQARDTVLQELQEIQNCRYACQFWGARAHWRYTQADGCTCEGDTK